MKIALRDGAGGEETSKLIHDIFASHFQNEILNKMEDAAVLRIFSIRRNRCWQKPKRNRKRRLF